MHTIWSDGRERRPLTQVPSTDTTLVRDHTRNPHGGYKQVQALMFEAERRGECIPAKERVLGLRLDTETRAYPSACWRSAPMPRTGSASKSPARTSRCTARTHRGSTAYDAAG